MKGNGTGKKLLMLAALGFAGGACYLYPYIRYVFYDWQLAAMGLSNTQLGFLTTIYGIFATILYLPAGMLADKYSPKRLMIIALLLVTAGTVGVAVNPDGGYGYMIAMWCVMAVPGGLFWGPLFKEIRTVAGEDSQGFFFGFYYMCNGLSGALINFVALKVGETGDSLSSKFLLVTIVAACATALAALFIGISINEKALAAENSDGEQLSTNDFHVNQVGGLLKSPVLWAFAAVIFSGYIIYSCNTYFTPYLSAVKGIDAADSSLLSVLRSYVFYILTPISGIIADKLFKSTSKWFMVLFTILACLYFGVMAIPSSAGVGFVSFYTLLPGLFGLSLYGIQFSIAGECKIPLALMGTATGIASIIGYSTDIWLAPLIGHWLDTYGNAGYNRLFIFIGCCCILGLCAVIFINRNKHKVDFSTQSAGE